MNCQPFVLLTAFGNLSLAHNGELVNFKELQLAMLTRGVGLFTNSDSELIAHSLAMPIEGETDEPDWPARIRRFMGESPLSYSLVIMVNGKLFAVRDSFGNRPLCLGKIEMNGEIDAWVVSR